MLHCDKLGCGVACGFQFDVCVSEILCWERVNVGGEGMEGTEEFYVVFDIVAEFEVWFCSMEGIGSVVGDA